MAYIHLELWEADGHLPDVCVYCGAPSTHLQKYQLKRLPLLLNLLMVIPPVYYIATLFARPGPRVQVPLCNRHRHPWIWNQALIWRSFAWFTTIGAVLILPSFFLPTEWREWILPIVSVIGYEMTMIWVIILCVADSVTISVTQVGKKEVLLSGVSKRFVAAVDAMDAKGQFRAASPKKPTPDAIEE